jgi:hypothetical protein
LTKRKKSDINKPLSGDNHATQKDQRQKWPFWIGTGGRFQSESLAVFVGMRTLQNFVPVFGNPDDMVVMMKNRMTTCRVAHILSP